MASKNNCCVPNCGKSRVDNITLHSFPHPEKEQERFNLWKDAIGCSLSFLESKFIYENRKICHDHFEKRYLTWTRRLSHNAVPTLRMFGCQGASEENKEKSTKQDDIVLAAMTQAKLPLVAEKPSQMRQESAMEVDRGGGDQHQHPAAPDHSDDQCPWRAPDDNVHDMDGRRAPSPTLYLLKIQSTIQTEIQPTESLGEEFDALQPVYTMEIESQTQPVDGEPQEQYVYSAIEEQDVQNAKENQHLQEASEEQYVQDLSEDPYVQDLLEDPYDQDVSENPYDQDVSEDPYVQDVSEAPYIQEVPQKRSHVKSSIEYRKKYFKGQCRCCLKLGVHAVVDVAVVMKYLNVRLSLDPRARQIVCSACSEFLQQVKTFRDMVAASERTLLAKLGIEIDMPPPAPGQQEDADAHAHEDDLKQDETEIKEEPELSAVVPPQEAADEGEAPDDRATPHGLFSQLSDYSDFPMDNKENDEILSTKNMQQLLRTMRVEQAKLNVYIRENLITLLEYSTVVPFASRRGDRFECIYCDGSFAHIDLLRAHSEEQHQRETTSFKHDILKIIPQSILRVDVSRIQCRICDTRLANIDGLVEHLVRVHKKKYHNLTLDPPHNILPFDLTLDVMKCLVCERTFKTFTKLRLHVSQHFGSFLCHQCGSKFLFHNQYSKHIQDHHRIKPVRSCDVCGKRFKTKKELLYHHNRNHYNPSVDDTKNRLPALEENPGAVYRCVLCQNNALFTGSNAAYMHRIGHLNNTRSGPFLCEMCEYITPVKDCFRRHLQSHYGIKNHECRICKRRFRKSDQLSDHMNVHLNLMFKCPLCDANLSNKKHLKQHVKNLHPDINVEISI